MRDGFDFVKADTIEATGDFVAKWGVAWELTGARQKQGKGGGRTPWEILAEYAGHQDPEDARLWREYADDGNGIGLGYGDDEIDGGGHATLLTSHRCVMRIIDIMSNF